MANDSFIACILEQVEAQQLSKRAATSFIDRYKRTKKQFEDAGNLEGAAKAAENEVQRYKIFKEKSERNLVKSIQRAQNDIKLIQDNNLDAVDFTQQKIQQIANRERDVEKSLHAVISPENAEAFDVGFLGLKREDPKAIEEGLRYASTPPEIADKLQISERGKSLGKDFRKLYQTQWEWLNSAGAVMGRIPNYTPVVHSDQAIAKMGKTIPERVTKLKAAATEAFDWSTMHNKETGTTFKSFEEFKPVLERWVKQKVYAPVEGGGKGLSASADLKNSEARWVKYKSFDHFLTYNNIVGGGDDLAGMVLADIKSAAREIALMDVAAPKQNSYFNALLEHSKKQMLERDGKINKLKINRLEGNITYIQKSFNATDPDGMLTNIVENVNNYHRGRLLPGAFVSSLTDPLYVRLAARHRDVPFLSAMKHYFDAFILKSPHYKELSRELEITSNSYMESAALAARYASESNKTRGLSAAYARLTMRASLLEASTKGHDYGIRAASANRFAWMMEKDLSFSQMEEAFPGMAEHLERFGMDERLWDFAKTHAKPIEVGGNPYIIPGHFKQLQLSGKDLIDAHAVANALTDFMTNFRNVGLNEGNTRASAFWSGSVAKGRGGAGSPERLALSSLGVFKSYPSNVYFEHLKPLVSDLSQLRPGGDSRARMRGLQDFGELVVLGSLAGAAVYQAKHVLKGRSMQDWDDWRLYKAGFLQMGALGLYGDFLFGGTSRFDRQPFQEMAGPTAGMVSDLLNLGIEPFKDKPKMRKKMARFVHQYGTRAIPLTNLWYTALPMQRFAYDHLERLINPQYDQDQRNTASRLKKQNQRWLWKPANFTPGN